MTQPGAKDTDRTRRADAIRKDIARLTKAAERYERDAGKLLDAMAKQGVASKAMVATNGRGDRTMKVVANPAGKLWKEATSTAKKIRAEIKQKEAELKKIEAEEASANDPMDEVYRRLKDQDERE